MRIIALSDIHGAYKQAEKILEKEKNYDLIVISGDITTNGTPLESTKALSCLQTFGKPIIAISGNMDSLEIDKTLAQLDYYINGRGILIGDIGFFGVSAAPFSPLNTPYEISEEEILSKAESGWKDIKDARWKVLVTHAPPYKTKIDRTFLRMHVGSKSIRNFIEKYEPDALICGHIHEAYGLDVLGKTKMVNCGSITKGKYATIAIETKVIMELHG